MKPVHDNDIDKLFREGLKDLEVAPSGRVANEIMHTNGSRKKVAFRISKPFLSIIILALLFSILKFPFHAGKSKEAVASTPGNTAGTSPAMASRRASNDPASSITENLSYANVKDSKKETRKELYENSSAIGSSGRIPEKQKPGEDKSTSYSATGNNHTPPPAMASFIDLYHEFRGVNEPAELQEMLPIQKTAVLAEKDLQVTPVQNGPGSFYRTQGFHVAPVAAFNTSWILKQNTYGGFENKKLAYKLSFGHSYGLALGYTFPGRLGVQVEYHFQSTGGQKYSDVVYKTTVNREVNLEYMLIPVIVKYRIGRVLSTTKVPVLLSINGGVQYGILRSAGSKVNEQSLVENISSNSQNDISERFNKTDLGLLLEVESDTYLSRKVFLSLSARGSVSVSDINAAAWKLTDSGYKSSQNMLLGAVIGLHYFIF